MKTLRHLIIAWGLAFGFSTVTAPDVLADTFFSDSELAHFYTMSNTNVCRDNCEFPSDDPTMGGYAMLRLEVLPPLDPRSVYLVRRAGVRCGTAGCESAVLLRQGAKMVLLEDHFGLDTDRAERIARRVLGIITSHESAAPSNQKTPAATSSPKTPSPPAPLAVIFAVLCVTALCVLAAIVTKRVASGLSIWQKIAIQSITTLVSSLGLYAFGIVDQFNLLTIPIIAGVTVSMAISVRDFLSS
jgi:hypothetical protein